ncbi:MAG: hypothetical protein OHK93_000615 [Ramalina farinacea]|uniref:PRELI/MSF1 domain-containing protein n=1 Tax=Ramalina farinacea TaxID=258253 RepID=A0AA43TV97_9LECA|nr:hypothetical protein [Ramalina farinacea]
MVKFYEHFFDYDYPFPAVSLAYFLRYPNPYATHVLSTDVIDRNFDAAAQRLTTTRLHLKKSKIPPAIYKILPRGFLGGSGDAGQSYILEKSVVDVKEGWMKTETKNLEWTGILSVVEKQLYQRVRAEGGGTRSAASDLVEATKNEGTNVTTTTTLLSRFGQAKLLRRRAGGNEKEAVANIPGIEEEGEPKKGFFSTWSTSGLQRSIEMVGLKRTREALGKSKDGMNVVLERLRKGGLVRVLEGMQQDSQRAFGETGPWKQSWGRGEGSADVD